jgi:alanyl-tRNA synthetase
MKKLSTSQLRKCFLDFFVARDHRLVKSDSLVPANDPSVLFTSAGMNQFKEAFLGKVKDYRRATSAQKCLRTGDLEEVGRTPFHHTFFEMLGNFSFGDYFKKEAISWGWEFVTKVLEVDAAKLWISVYEDDSEAYDIWRNIIGLPAAAIKKMGPRDNFWPANAIKDGPNGPCGPCSEIYYERKTGDSVEIWNLVFTQFNRLDDSKLEPLPNKNIDTGMGLERMASVLQGVDSNFKIDIFLPIVDAVRKSVDSSEDKILNMIADHARAVTFCIADGVLPSNDGRGYVVRKLIRRCAFMAQREAPEPFVYKIVSAIAGSMGDQYPELPERRDNIAGIIKAEEEKYIKNILEGGAERLSAVIENLKRSGQIRLPAEVAFDLFVTYGIQPDFTKEFCAHEGVSVDGEAIDALIVSEQNKSRASGRKFGAIFSTGGVSLKPSVFVGYESDSVEAKIVQIIKDNKDIREVSVGEQADEVGIILDKTPFYGESGGQVGDKGVLIVKGSDLKVRVTDVVKEAGSFLHVCDRTGSQTKESSCLKVGQIVSAHVDSEHREAVKRAHTATHILQAALRKVLGVHVQQAGSFVEPDRFRFDFTHFKDISAEDLERIQGLLNDYVIKNDPLKADVMKKEEAQKTGAIALFGEKYEDTVRVVSIADYSKEFCGGTHLDATGKIGFILIQSESSVGSGLRRIEALTGKLAYAKVRQTAEIVQDVAQMLKTGPDQILDSCDQLLKRCKALEKELSNFQEKDLEGQVTQLVREAQKIREDILVVHDFKNYNVALLRKAADLLKKEVPKGGVFVLSSQAAVVCGSTSSHVAANVILQKILPLAGGTGGGRKDFAQGGVKDASKMGAVLKEAQRLIVEGETE